MTTFGWIVISVLSSFVGYLIFNLIKEYVINKKLNQFRVKNNMTRIILSPMIYLKKAYQIVLATMLVAVVGVSGVFSPDIRLDNNKILTQAHQVGSKAKLLSLLETQNRNYNQVDGFPEAALGDDLDAMVDQERDFIDTNSQVDGVSEADIIKTDGNYIYYASRYYQNINVIYVDQDYHVDVLADIDLGDVYTDNMYLTEDYIVIIGYTYDETPYQFIEGDMVFGWVYREPSGTVIVIDRETYEIAYQLETDAYFYDHRMIDDQIYLVSSKYVYEELDELRPRFIETKNSNEKTSYVGYDEIYYYEDVIASNMTVLTSINLSDFSYDAQAFVGYVSQLYVNETSIYTVYNYYKYTLDVDESQNGPYAQILKFNINQENATISYQGGQIIKGHVVDQYWMDEYEGYLRVVTSNSWPAKNRLYILEEDLSEDVLNIVSTIDENLGLEGETVKSVRFNKDYAQVVTFLQTDPLYTIDLSDPLNPFIKDDPIIEEGYSTYMHIWDEDNHVIGFGFDATEDGRITGLKLSAYDTNQVEPLETYSFASNPEQGYSYSFSEAIYNPKALMIDASKGIVGFPMNSYHYDTQNYYYESAFVIFFIDFDSSNIISEPIMITHDQSEYYMSVDRGIYIENIVNDVVTDRYIYTFSYLQVVVYHVESDMIIQKETLNEDIFGQEYLID
ncbi:MAG: beta-propeller domain-containing protein [Acholeplasmataceae bacterium]|nr:beta-propeller domain-containing protein [Acholeplasmataceae bacterium]